MKLTKKAVEALEIKQKPYFIFDNTVPGFSIHVSDKGKRHYCFQYTRNKRVKRMWLGQHGIMTTEQARSEAIAKLSEVKAGGDPQADKMRKNKELYISDVAKRFFEDYVKLRCKKSSQVEYKRHLEVNIAPVLKDIKISELEHSDVLTLHHKLRKKPYEANRCISVLSKMCSMAEKWGMRKISTNPCKHVEKYPEKARSRYLTDEETQRLADTLEEIKSYPDENLSAVYCIQLLLFTGCRLGEIRTLKWEYIDYEKKLFRLPDSKTGSKIVYAGAIVMNLLDEIKNNPARPEDNPYVIWGRKPNTCLNDLQNAWRRFLRAAEIENLRIHDLRHSFASFIVNEGTSLAMISKLLGHTQIQTTERYSHIMADPLIKTAEKVTEKLGKIFSVSTQPVKQIKTVRSTDFVKGTNVRAPVFFTAAQAAEYLKVKTSLLDFWRWKKRGPEFVKVGNRVRYKVEDLDKFVKKSGHASSV